MDRYRFAVFALWLGAGDRIAVATAARATAQAVAGLPADAHADEERATLAWLNGLVAVTEGDRRGLAAARAAAQRSRAPAYIVRTLRALALRFGGSAVQLGEALVAADAGEKWDESGPEIRTQVLSINRLAEADAFLAAGDTARAQRLLVWHEAELNNGDNLTPQLFAPLAYYRLARIEQAQGRFALAREHYHQFLRRYDQPVPNLRPLVEQARSALATIETAGERVMRIEAWGAVLIALLGSALFASPAHAPGCRGGASRPGDWAGCSTVAGDCRGERSVAAAADRGADRRTRPVPFPVAAGGHLRAAAPGGRLPAHSI